MKKKPKKENDTNQEQEPVADKETFEKLIKRAIHFSSPTQEKEG